MSDLYDRTNVNKIVIHHFADGQGPATTADELRRRANPPQPGYPNGYQFAEYDFGILADGSVVELRPLTFIGAHAKADKAEYMYGGNWWNKNSASVVIATDASHVSGFPLPLAMVQGLINFLAGFCKPRSMTINDCYPHFQITATLCPGASYKKLGLDTGFLDYDMVEAAVNENLKGKVVSVENPIIVVFGWWDLILGYGLAEKLRAPVISRAFNWRAGSFNKFYIVGGPPEAGADVVNLTGVTWEDTARAVLEVL
jgi:hypothetical protein